MNNLNKILQYRKQIDQAHRQVAMAEGALERSLKDLSDLGCDSIAEGETKLKRLRTKVAKLKKEANDKLTQFEKKWRDVL